MKDQYIMESYKIIIKRDHLIKIKRNQTIKNSLYKIPNIKCQSFINKIIKYIWKWDNHIDGKYI